MKENSLSTLPDFDIKAEDDDKLNAFDFDIF